jgi:outer membrane immunogenic protein
MHKMKKTYYLMAVALMFITGTALGQGSLPKGGNQLNLGVGLSSWGIPVYVGIDHGVHPDITVGGEFTYRAYKENWKKEDYNHSILGFSGNANYHFNRVLNIQQDWDFYAGLNVGFYVWSSPSSYEGSRSSGLGLGGQVGGRYYLNDKLGLNLEFGGGNAFSGGKFGVTVKL